MKKKKIIIVVSDYYTDLSKKITTTIIKQLKAKYIHKIVKVPGAFEIPITISRKIKNFDAAIAVGCIIKGKTPHFDHIARASIDGIMRVSLDNKKPIGNCILTCLTKKQALERINKGSEAAKAVTSILSK